MKILIVDDDELNRTMLSKIPDRARHPLLITVLWLAVLTAFCVSVFTVIEEMCLKSACSDAAAFTFFGLNMGIFGIVYFTIMLILLALRNKRCWLDIAFSAMIFAGIGAECRLLWIQKFIIGSWCPLCVTICCTLFVAAAILVIENILQAGCDGEERKKKLLAKAAFVLILVVTGFGTAMLGVRELV